MYVYAIIIVKVIGRLYVLLCIVYPKLDLLWNWLLHKKEPGLGPNNKRYRSAGARSVHHQQQRTEERCE